MTHVISLKQACIVGDDILAGACPYGKFVGSLPLEEFY
jgi:hypothetical protein